MTFKPRYLLAFDQFVKSSHAISYRIVAPTKRTGWATSSSSCPLASSSFRASGSSQLRHLLHLNQHCEVHRYSFQVQS